MSDIENKLQNEDAKTKLMATEDDLNKTKLHNSKIIGKFRALIED